LVGIIDSILQSQGNSAHLPTVAATHVLRYDYVLLSGGHQWWAR